MENKRIIALCGKGGVGKTAITSMILSLLSTDKDFGKVLVIDADPAQGLTYAIDAKIESTMGKVRDELIHKAKSTDKNDLVDFTNSLDYLLYESLYECENFSLLAMGRSEEKGCFCPVNDLLQQAISKLSGEFDTILIDGEAGLEQINRQIVKKLNNVLIISDASVRGFETIKQIKSMVTGDAKVVECQRYGVIFNRVSDQHRTTLKFKLADINVDLVGVIPQDSSVAEFDFCGKSLLALPADSEALASLKSVIQYLR
ncbi:AAA family ATPase [Shewanella yunxiaonensis]|uniref:AAA family ATPase n=1 Tax=Shewanella yunxiaonensis TaxID=2829809 RepID=A0ABX7YW02_9GAMM|nr:AAA family ATPase [Shewanella yunxiaonensis]QUN06992.1 AAA family ATPase [Shewanella yunxiaonensis]